MVSRPGRWGMCHKETGSLSILIRLHYAQLQERNDPNRKVIEQQKALENEAARVAQERRELRMEMARMRKEMREMSAEEAGSEGQSIQERMATLDNLLAEGLISREEYEQKRQDILNEI